MLTIVFSGRSLRGFNVFFPVYLHFSFFFNDTLIFDIFKILTKKLRFNIKQGCEQTQGTECKIFAYTAKVGLFLALPFMCFDTS